MENSPDCPGGSRGSVGLPWYSHGGSCTSRRDSCTGAGSGRKNLWEARDVIETYEEELGNCPVILTLDGQEKETTAKELGLYWSNENQIEETLKEYAGGSLIRQYMVKKDLARAPVELAVETAVDPEKVTAFVDTHSQDILTQPQNASIRRENGAFCDYRGSFRPRG